MGGTGDRETLDEAASRRAKVVKTVAGGLAERGTI